MNRFYKILCLFLSAFTATAFGNFGSMPFGFWKTSAPSGFTVNFLVQAGGGAGGYYVGSSSDASAGGGGGGGLVIGTDTISKNTTYSITVGAGGTGYNSSNFYGNSGGNSVFASAGASFTAYGGAGGAPSPSASGSVYGLPGLQGGSGSGGSDLGGGATGGSNNLITYSTATSYGSAGGGAVAYSYSGGGGGGAIQAGSPSTSGYDGGNGGNGYITNYYGYTNFGAGGGGGAVDIKGTGGSGGGGNGGDINGEATNGSGYGSGGGGTGYYDTQLGNGSAGCVIIVSPNAATATTGSPTVTTSGSNYVYLFTSSGSIKF